MDITTGGVPFAPNASNTQNAPSAPTLPASKDQPMPLAGNCQVAPFATMTSIGPKTAVIK